MEFLQKALSESLHTGFIDQLNQSNAEYLPQIIINDKSVGKKVLTTIDNELKKCEEFWFSVAFVTISVYAIIADSTAHASLRALFSEHSPDEAKQARAVKQRYASLA